MSDFLTIIAKAPAEKQEEMLAKFVEMSGETATVEELRAKVKTRERNLNKAADAAKRKAENDAIRARLEALTAEVEEAGSVDSDLFERVTEAGGKLVVSAVNEDGEVSFSVEGLKAPRVGGSGGGKPAATAPRPFVVAGTDTRVIGHLNKWAHDNLSDEDIADLGDMPTKADGTLKGSKKLERALVNQGHLERRALDA